jgi:hypothetical protein
MDYDFQTPLCLIRFKSPMQIRTEKRLYINSCLQYYFYLAARVIYENNRLYTVIKPVKIFKSNNACIPKLKATF